jgi:hypothetical protein
MDPNCKPIHARAYTVLRSVEQQLQQSKDFLSFLDIGVQKYVFIFDGILEEFNMEHRFK